LQVGAIQVETRAVRVVSGDAMTDRRKQSKTGSLGLSQSKARNLATGIGQTRQAATMTGASRSMRVVMDMPATQKAALCHDSGYPTMEAAEYPATAAVARPEKHAAKPLRLDGKTA
jgi:hypothetical protein